MSRTSKRTIFFATDTILVPISFYAANALRYGDLHPDLAGRSSLFVAVTLIGMALVGLFRLPQIKLNAFETRAVGQIGLAAAALSVAAMICSYLMGIAGPRSVPLIFGSVFFLSAVAVRLGALSLLTRLGERGSDRQVVLIYGAGAAGIQLAAALTRSHETRPVGFIDDNPTLQGLMVAGLPVCAPPHLDRMIARHGVRRILLAIPSASAARRAALERFLSSYPVDVQVLPSFADLMAGKGVGDGLRTVTPDALLGRDAVDLSGTEIADTYSGRVVMVTGAGGSIGSELCRQLVQCAPARIVLFESSEFQLYTIDRELRELAGARGVSVSTRLGSVTDRARAEQVIAQDGVQVILHAAAYKHVPLVEENALEGTRNNVLGTQVMAEVAAVAGIERFTLISSDKAVRPANAMGATKRLAELVVQDLQTRHPATRFSMVRFGNVLGSSGSVLPLFQKQIQSGGPVTVTDPEVTRFFMTIPEAARLVLLAGAYARGGDIFVLDMGRPQKIIDIARRMIELSGRSVRDPQTGAGDIAIEITGLRPGEKLYEELLIDADNLMPTPHAKILWAEEQKLSQIEVAAMLREVQACIAEADTERLRTLFAARVEGYHWQERVVTKAG
ncbi:MAG: nucleoside-diphosphate sugar epimerase/dehydratase [Pseudomonadota bacterium]